MVLQKDWNFADGKGKRILCENNEISLTKATKGIRQVGGDAIVKLPIALLFILDYAAGSKRNLTPVALLFFPMETATIHFL